MSRRRFLVYSSRSFCRFFVTGDPGLYAWVKVIVALRYRDITNAVGHLRGGLFRCRGRRGLRRRGVDICRAWDLRYPKCVYHRGMVDSHTIAVGTITLLGVAAFIRSMTAVFNATSGLIVAASRLTKTASAFLKNAVNLILDSRLLGVLRTLLIQVSWTFFKKLSVHKM